ncbi:hypothetical protein IQ07DRAFT_591562 [Pyrenochaeta sp. DS3sAY3a]|nr:hypothetical protein IQ07DRAFT_591562 [Pyrenochaeta sp. DS3sAY3a]
MTQVPPSSQPGGSSMSISPPRRLRSQATVLPHGIDIKNIIDLPDRPFSLRDRSAKYSKLKYDFKYHPMDESIRPSQAAKRRSIHGERLLLSDTSFGSNSSDNGSDTTALADDELEFKEVSQPLKRGRKRKRARMQSPRNLRRSSRKIEVHKTAYDMNVHPQDEDLELSSSSETRNESEGQSPEAENPPWSSSHIVENSTDEEFSSVTGSDPYIQKLLENPTGIDDTDKDDGIKYPDSILQDVNQPDIEDDLEQLTLPSTVLTSAVYLPPDTGCKDMIDGSRIPSSARTPNQDFMIGTISPGLPFEIHEEQPENQLMTGLVERSFVDNEHDNKENSMDYTDVEESSVFEETAIMPGSHHVRSNEHGQTPSQLALVSHALYDSHEGNSHVYGLEDSMSSQLRCG